MNTYLDPLLHPRAYQMNNFINSIKTDSVPIYAKAILNPQIKQNNNSNSKILPNQKQNNDYSYDEYLKYTRSRNYQGAIDYLNSFNFEGEDAITVRRELNNLKRAAAIEESLSNKLAGDDKDAYNFIRGLHSGFIDHNRREYFSDGTSQDLTNSYGTNYNKNINSVTTKDGKLIDSFVVEIDNKDALIRLQNKLQENGADKDYFGIEFRSTADGKYQAVIDRDNTNLYKLYNTTKSLQTLSDAARLTFGAFGFINQSALSLPFGVSIGNYTAEKVGEWTSDYSFKALAGGREYKKNDFKFNNIKDAVDIVNKAEEKYNKLNENIEGTTYSELSVSGYMSGKHARAAELAASGAISTEEYNRITKIWSDYIATIVDNCSFATQDKKVYVWGNEDGDTEGGEIQTGRVLKLVKNTDALNAQEELKLAIQEGRASYSMATKDGRRGLKFDIKPKKKENGDILDDFGNREMSIFVEGLYTDGEEEYYNADTKTQAAQTNADMKKLGYSMTLSNGETIGYKNGIPYKQVYNRTTSQLENVSISEAEALQALNESAIIDGSIDYINKHYNPDTNLIEKETNTETETISVKDFLKQVASDMVDEIYPKGQYSKRNRGIKEILLYNRLTENLPNNYKA